jgi:osmoprotectant transport system permease protein
MPNIKDRLLFLLSSLGFAAVFFAGFLNKAPNRLAASTPLSLFESPTFEATCTILSLGLLLALSFFPSEKARPLASLGAAMLLLWASLAAASNFAAELAKVSKPAARLSLGPAFWILVSVALLAMLNGVQKAKLSLLARLGFGLVLLAALVVIAQAGIFDDLSLAREFASHRSEFAKEFLRHLALVGAAIFFALAFGIPLTVLVSRTKASRGFVFGSLGILQTFPSIALFGLLITPLSALTDAFPLLKALGIGATGPAPAIIALTLYSLLPLVRGFFTGLANVPADVKDAALGLGYDRRRLLFEVELPLALPALLSALRVVTIQAIGLATVAALIGAGGLGTFVFQGIGQYAMDLVLVAALPIIGLALLADMIFQMLLFAARRRP